MKWLENWLVRRLLGPIAKLSEVRLLLFYSCKCTQWCPRSSYIHLHKMTNKVIKDLAHQQTFMSLGFTYFFYSQGWWCTKQNCAGKSLAVSRGSFEVASATKDLCKRNFKAFVMMLEALVAKVNVLDKIQLCRKIWNVFRYLTYTLTSKGT